MKLETIALHNGYKSEATTKSAAVPIYQTTSYTFDNTQHGADLFNLVTPGNIYTRIMNPTNDVLEKRISAMENGIGALCVSSGMAAITYAIECISSVGSNIVSISNIYGGTYNLFAHTFPKQGIEVRMANYNDYEKIKNYIDKKTTAIFCETITNPSGNIVDIEKMAKIAHNRGIPLIVDNTIATPYLCQPINFGADIVVHSLTKYIGGHGTTIGGVIIDSGNFDWQAQKEKFPIFSEPDPSYNGIIYTEAFEKAAYIGRCRVVPLRNKGAALSPFNAFQILQGLETLGLRIDRHCTNTEEVAKYLTSHKQVKWVNYATMPNSNDYATCKKITKGRASGIISFGIKGETKSAEKFINSLEMILRLVNIGDAKSLACHPASTTHRQLNEKELQTAGVSNDLIRISVGIENIEDILADIEQALEKSVLN